MDDLLVSETRGGVAVREQTAYRHKNVAVNARDWTNVNVSKASFHGLQV